MIHSILSYNLEFQSTGKNTWSKHLKNEVAAKNQSKVGEKYDS